MMKTILFTGFITAAILFAACGNKNYVQEAGFCTATPEGDSVAIPFGQTVSLFTACKDNVQASISSINDSRCPEGVQCVWAGKLDIVFKMGELSIPLEKDKVVDTLYQGNRYTINLVDAVPRPVQAEVKPQQTVSLKIMRASRRAVGPDNAVPLTIDSARINKPLSKRP
jgi:hypothetical protein